MEQPVLSDKNLYPDAGVLARFLGAAMPAWGAFTQVLETDYPQVSAEWRYYNDGKSWLFKVTRKSKTLCWVSVRDGYFRVGSYFGVRAEQSIRESAIDPRLKKQYLDADRTTKLRLIRVDVRKKDDVKLVRQLIELKDKMK